MLLVTKGKMILCGRELTESYSSFGWKVKILSNKTGHRAGAVTLNQLGGKAWGTSSLTWIVNGIRQSRRQKLLSKKELELMTGKPSAYPDSVLWKLSRTTIY